MAKFLVRRPFGEPDLRDEVRRHPVGGLVGLDAFGERRLFRLARFEQLPDSRQFLGVEPGAGVPDILQPAGLRAWRSGETSLEPCAEQQRTEVLPALSRFRPAADHELLLVDDLQLAPRRAATARLIRTQRLLDDEPFPAFAGRALVHRATVLLDLLADPDHSAGQLPQHLLQAHPPLRQGLTADVFIAVAKDVECDERHRLGLLDPLDVACVGEVNPALKLLESSRTSIRIEGDDFAVYQHRRREFRPPFRQRLNDRGELGCLLVAEAGPEPYFGAAFGRFDAHQRANPVVFRFVDESGPGQRRLRERRQHRPHLRRILSPAHVPSVLQEIRRSGALYEKARKFAQLPVSMHDVPIRSADS